MSAPLPPPVIQLSELTPILKSELCNGCGPTSWKFKGHTWRSKLFAIPTPGGSAACNQHDLDYWIGGTEEMREQADQRLRDGMITLAQDRWFLARWMLTWEAHRFYTLVRREGKQYWNMNGPRTRDDLKRLEQLVVSASITTSPPEPPRTAA